MAKLSLYLIFAIFLSPVAHAQQACQTVFSEFDSRENSAPLEVRYVSRAGAPRFFRDGSIWQLQNKQWVAIGTGSFDGRTVFESALQPSNLSALSNFAITSSLSQGVRFFPNVKGNYPALIRTVNVGSHKIEIQAPVNMGLEVHVDGVFEVLKQLPLKRIEALKVIRLNTRASSATDFWRAKYKNFTDVAALGGNTEIDLFSVILPNFHNADGEATRILRHEFGHLIASTIFGSPNPSPNYIAAANSDPFAVSEYGRNSWAEDFAEGIEAYLRSSAGNLQPAVRNNLRNRFAFYDDVFTYRMPQSEPIPMTIKIVDSRYLYAISPEAGVGLVIDLLEPAK